MAGNTVSVAAEPTNNQMELIYQDAVGTIWDTWKANDGAWGKLRLTDIGGETLITAGACTKFFNKWRDFQIIQDDYMMTECSMINGINAYCIFAKRPVCCLTIEPTARSGHREGGFPGFRP